MYLDRLVFMGHAFDHLNAYGLCNQDQLQLVFLSDPMALRGALKKTVAFLTDHHFLIEECGPVELAVAEAVNNIIEHAYQEQDTGVIELNVEYTKAWLRIKIIDDGLPMPEGVAPQGRQHNLNVEIDDLPEGGFGWFLIRELTQNLEYTRAAARNVLTFEIQTPGRQQ